MGSGEVIGIACHSGSDHFCVDFRSPLLGRSQTFNDQRTGSFAHHKSVPLHVKRTGRMLVIFIICRQCLGRVESAHTAFINRRFRTAAHDDVGFAQPDVVGRIDEGIVGTGAGRDHRKVESTQSMTDRNDTGRNVGDDFLE
jgi:hypothetical protein